MVYFKTSKFQIGSSTAQKIAIQQRKLAELRRKKELAKLKAEHRIAQEEHNARVKEERRIRNAKIKERLAKDARSSIFVKAGSGGVKRILALRSKKAQ